MILLILLTEQLGSMCRMADTALHKCLAVNQDKMFLKSVLKQSTLANKRQN